MCCKISSAWHSKCFRTRENVLLKTVKLFLICISYQKATGDAVKVREDFLQFQGKFLLVFVCLINMLSAQVYDFLGINCYYRM
jgi:hypothetical protein